MWKRDDAVKPTPPAGSGPATGQSGASTSVTPSSGDPVRTVNEPQRGLEKTTVNIGKSVVIKGELSGSEDLKNLAAALKSSEISAAFPDNNPTKLIRRGTLSCSPSSGTCTFVMAEADSITSVD